MQDPEDLIKMTRVTLAPLKQRPASSLISTHALIQNLVTPLPDLEQPCRSLSDASNLSHLLTHSHGHTQRLAQMPQCFSSLPLG